MSTQLNPYLHFEGDARDAITFYQSVFGGDLALMTFGELGLEGDQADRLAHSHLASPDGLVIMASDTPPGGTVNRGDAVNLSLNGDDDATLRGWFEQLSDGGEIHVPLDKQPWGDVFGQCADKYGVTWLVNINQPV
ncbi:MAG: VOC family protein [Nocardioides sp.]|jgi:PhnB protein